MFVREADGERHVGSWQAGTPEEGLAFFTSAATTTCWPRSPCSSGASPPTPTTSRTCARPAGTWPSSSATAAAVGDLAALRARVAAVDEHAVNRAAKQQARRAEAAKVVLAAKEALVVEAEGLVTSTEWKATGDRLRTIAEEWRGMRGGDKKAESALWRRLSAARAEFTKRRSAHFAALDEQRATSASRKEGIVAEAEALAESADWAATAGRYKQLMSDWKAAGRAARDVDDALWQRFRAAQDAFFARRNAVYAERDAEFEGNQKVKEALLAEAEALDPTKDLDAATAALRAHPGALGGGRQGPADGHPGARGTDGGGRGALPRDRRREVAPAPHQHLAAGHPARGVGGQARGPAHPREGGRRHRRGHRDRGLAERAAGVAGAGPEGVTRPRGNLVTRR